MRVIIDIGHPAHVHVFKNFAWGMAEKGHKVLFTVRDKECASYLLEKYGFEYILLGKGRTDLFGKVKLLKTFISKTVEISKEFKPDLFLSHGSISAAFASKLMHKPHLALEDTGNLEQVLLYKLFTDIILSPESLRLNLGRKHIKYNGYHELAYLHPKYFNPDIGILDILGVKNNEKFVILRFSAYSATHDFGYGGIPLKYKLKCAEGFSKLAKVFISSEAELAPDLKRFGIKIPLDKIHDALYYARLVYSEGAKTASEAAILGTPAIYVNFKGVCYTRELEEKYGMVYNFKNSKIEYEKSIQKGAELLKESNTKEYYHAKRQQIIDDNIDITAFLVWFVENYPKSLKAVRSNPDYQFRFNKSYVRNLRNI